MPIFNNLENYIGGWFIGDFDPSILRTKEFEICVVSHRRNETTRQHYHTSSTEINLVLSGKLEVNGRLLHKNDIFIYEKNEVSDVHFIADSELCVIRVPSAPNDKVLV